MKKALYILSVILPLTLPVLIISPVYAQTILASAYNADPTYSASGKSDPHGLTGNYIYKFADGEKDAAPGDCLLMINGRFTNADVIIKNNRSFAPVRVVAEAFGATVMWDNESQTVSIASGSIVISMKIGQPRAIVNVKTVPLDEPPIIINGLTYVPLRFISDYMNKTVGYLPAGQGTGSEYLAAVSNREAAKGLAYNPVVWIDDPVKTNVGAPTDQTLPWLKAQMNRGLRNLRNNIDTANNGYLKGTDPDSPVFTQIENAISNAYYIGNVGRYAMYQGPYATLVDTATESVYFYTIAHELCGIWQADMGDPDTFVPMYFAD